MSISVLFTFWDEECGVICIMNVAEAGVWELKAID
jgi:hypothetical protein